MGHTLPTLAVRAKPAPSSSTAKPSPSFVRSSRIGALRDRADRDEQFCAPSWRSRSMRRRSAAPAIDPIAPWEDCARSKLIGRSLASL